MDKYVKMNKDSNKSPQKSTNSGYRISGNKGSGTHNPIKKGK